MTRNKGGLRERRARARAFLFYIAYAIACGLVHRHLNNWTLLPLLCACVAAYNFGAWQTRRSSRIRLARAVAAARKESP